MVAKGNVIQKSEVLKKDKTKASEYTKAFEKILVNSGCRCNAIRANILNAFAECNYGNKNNIQEYKAKRETHTLSETF
jgi:hypothetical protein